MAGRRALALTILALAWPAFALGGSEPAASPTLSVSASLGSCGLSSAAIVCEIEASWSSVPGAERYAVTVTRPDGSVIDLGSSGGTGRTLYVAYAGPGNYSIQVEAWGTPPGAEDAEPLATEEAVPSAPAPKAGARERDTPSPAETGDEPEGTDEPEAPAPSEPPEPPEAVEESKAECDVPPAEGLAGQEALPLSTCADTIGGDAPGDR